MLGVGLRQGRVCHQLCVPVPSWGTGMHLVRIMGRETHASYKSYSCSGTTQPITTKMEGYRGRNSEVLCTIIVKPSLLPSTR